jgi:NADH-quinone oxidoreductase subunit K
MITLSHYLVLSAILFVIGVTGVLMRRNVIIILLSIELMLTAVNLNFIAFSHYMKNPATLGLAIVVALFRNLETVNVDEINQMKG